MKVNEKNIKVATAIVDVLENEKCTVDETREILTFLINNSGKKSTVQLKDIISELKYQAEAEKDAG